MAHVQKRTRAGQTRWVARYTATDGKERSRTFDRKVDADRWVATQTADQARGEWVDPALGRLTFGEYVDQWLGDPNGWRSSTEARNVGIVRLHLLPRFGSAPLAKLTGSDVKAMIAEQLAEDYAPATVRKHVLVLRGVLEDAMRDGRIGRNVAADVKLPPEDSRDMRFLDPGQVYALAESFPDYYRPLILTAAYVGLRWGELAGLKVGKVDTLRRTITVDEQLIEVAGKPLAFGPPKTKAGVRSVAIPATIADMLGEHMSRPAVRDSGLVFPTKNGKPMRRSNFRRRWTLRVDRLFGGTDLEGIVFHELRHTAAALAIAHGAHPLTIKERLGHSSITVTMDRYGHLFPAQDEALADALDGTLRGSMTGPRRDRTTVADAFVQVSA